MHIWVKFSGTKPQILIHDCSREYMCHLLKLARDRQTDRDILADRQSRGPYLSAAGGPKGHKDQSMNTVKNAVTKSKHVISWHCLSLTGYISLEYPLKYKNWKTMEHHAPKFYLVWQGQSHQVINIDVMWKCLIQGICMPRINTVPYIHWTLQAKLSLKTDIHTNKLRPKMQAMGHLINHRKKSHTILNTS